MRQLAIVIALAAAPLAVAAQAPSVDQASTDAVARMGADAAGQVLEGKPVLGAKGDVLGHVERVTAAPDGKPGQLLVRPKGMASGGPRSIAFAAVQVTPKGLQTPLTKAEFAAMPAVGAGR